jgi:hypothetical protein
VAGLVGEVSRQAHDELSLVQEEGVEAVEEGDQRPRDDVTECTLCHRSDSLLRLTCCA